MSVQKPDSANGLKVLSQQFRDNILKLNLNTPPDIVMGINDTEGLGALQAYEYSIGKDTVIDNYSVKNPGDITSEADKVRGQILAKNRPITSSDFSELDDNSGNLGFTYQALSDSIGKMVQLSDYSIPTLQSVSSKFDLSSDSSVKLNTILNKFVPEQYDSYDSSYITPVVREIPYVDDNGQLNSQYINQTYTPEDVLNINISNTGYNYVDDPVSYINYSGKVLQNETLLMNIAALELRGAFDARIQRELERDSPLTNIKDALHDPLEAINILKDPLNNLIAKNYDITIPNNPIGRVAQFTNSLLGTSDIFQYLTLGQTSDLVPSCFNTSNQSTAVTDKTATGRLLDDIFGKSSQGADNARDISTLANTGSGQKFQLFSNLYFNRYAPSFDPTYESGIFQALDKTLQAIGGVTGFLGLTGGKRPASRYYYGSPDNGVFYPFFVMQDAEGDQVNSIEQITNAIKTDFTGEVPGGFYEPGYDEVSGYGSISTDFVWHKEGYLETFYDPASKQTDSAGNISYNTLTKIDGNPNIDLSTVYSTNFADRFRECSILYKTQRLLDKADTDHGMNLVIDQTKTKFYDQYTLYAKGNATLSVETTQAKDNTGKVIGNTYTVPGLRNGKRNATEMNDKAEFCRTWTKARPYIGVSNLVRFTELIRLERSSVMDRYNNYNIFPSKLNVIPDKKDNLGNIIAGNATKYMFSIENLAWRDQTKFTDSDSLKAFEKGPNNGRIMWFPPYDLKFTDDTSVNWTSHQFLGRPEPIYTYNNTERSGSLSFKVIVDHPTILNVLVRKELAKLNDTIVDEILNSFWAGCVNFDIFELARIWGQFSNSDIGYFQQVIGDIQGLKSNSVIKPAIENSGSKDPVVVVNNSNTLQNIPGLTKTLYFENNTPLPADDSSVSSYDVYFTKYSKLAQGDTTQQTAEAILGKPYAGYVNYDETIGVNSSDKYFNSFSNNTDEKYRLYQNYNELVTSLQNYSSNHGYNATISIDAFTSALDSQDSDYNKKLAVRRYKSIAKLIIKSYTDAVDSNNQPLNDAAIDKLFDSNNKIVIYRAGGTQEQNDSVTIKLNSTITTAPLDVMTSIGGVEYIKSLTGTNIPVCLITEGIIPFVDYGVYYCTTDDANAQLLINVANLNGGVLTTNSGKVFTGVTQDFISSLVPNNRSYNKADIICSVTSIQASYSRKAKITVSFEVNPSKSKNGSILGALPPSLPDQGKPTSNTVTKRDIAQRILNAMITEADYFDMLQNDSPFIYKSLKEKLKYFTPAFHSMTPEGLNSRLTFLQQCLRPGDTIKSSNAESCDATNTAFGKPPVCVLRIGDFYNTKIIINSCNISYDPMIYDLNPEGIGVQPMIANVNLSFKYLGGSGLKGYVNELQNALSFNYYANADIYDSRTSANQDPTQKAAINQERDPFNNNTLDLIPIVEKAKLYQSNDTTGDALKGLVGDIVGNSYLATYLGDTSYSLAMLTGVLYDGGTVYLPNAYVKDLTTGIYGFNFWKRLFDDKVYFNQQANVAGKPVSDTTAWEPVNNTNFGQQAYLDEYGQNGYFETYDVNYKNLYKTIYDQYIANINEYVKFITYDSTNTNKFLFNTLLNVNYTGKTSSDDAVFMTNIQSNIGKVSTTGSSINSYFKNKSLNKNYSSVMNYSPLSFDVENSGSSFSGGNAIGAPQLYLYPQNLFYKEPKLSSDTNITSMLTGTTFNPGNFMDGDVDASDVSTLYLKKPISQNYLYSLFNHFIKDINQKIDNDLLVFWFSDTNVLNAYMSDYSESQRNILRQYLKAQLNSYFGSTYTNITNNMIDSYQLNIMYLSRNIAGLSYILSGYDALVINDIVQQQYAVIPNQNKLTVSSETMFGYDPYNTYLKIYLNSGNNYNDLVDLGDVLGNFTGTITNDTIQKFGNGLYFFRQIATDTHIVNSALLLNNTHYNTTDNHFVLPKSIALNSSTVIAGDVNNYEIKSSYGDTNIMFDDTNVIDTTDFNALITTLGNKEPNGSTLTNKYKMTYTFEKISYEFFEFVNKTLGIVLNDNSDNYNINIVTDQSKNFKSRYSLISTSFSTTVQKNLYYALFPGLKSDLTSYDNGTDLIYYNVSGTSTNVDYNNAIKALNNALNYTINLNEDFVTNAYNNYTHSNNIDISTKTALTTLTGTTPTILASSLSEAALLDFFGQLFSNKDTHITAIMSKMSADVNTSNLSDRQKTRAIKNIQNNLGDFFDEINTYITNINKLYGDLIKLYGDNVLTPLNNYINVSFNTIGNQQAPTSGKVTGQNLLKGGDPEYTLKLRLVKNIVTPDSAYRDVLNNAIIFNHQRINTDDAEALVKNITK